MQDQKNHLIGLDGLKALGCIAVAFFWHYQHFGQFSNPPLYKMFFLLYQSGGIAVELFLMISGFTMQMTYAERVSNHQISFGKFIMRRLRKIWPLSMITLISVTILEAWHIHLTGQTFVVQNFDIYHFVLNCAMLQAGWWENSYSFNTPAWFLSTLLLCYILFYMVNYVVGNRGKLYNRISTGIVILGLICIVTNCRLPFLHAGFAARGHLCFWGGYCFIKI